MYKDFSQDAKFNVQNNLLEAELAKIERKIILKPAKVDDLWIYTDQQTLEVFTSIVNATYSKNKWHWRSCDI